MILYHKNTAYAHSQMFEVDYEAYVLFYIRRQLQGDNHGDLNVNDKAYDQICECEKTLTTEDSICSGATNKDASVELTL